MTNNKAQMTKEIQSSKFKGKFKKNKKRQKTNDKKL
jgi:hypothetical protein